MRWGEPNRLCGTVPSYIRSACECRGMRRERSRVIRGDDAQSVAGVPDHRWERFTTAVEQARPDGQKKERVTA